MTEHTHKWYYDNETGFYQCEVPDCLAGMGVASVLRMLNATERLSVEDVRKMVIISDDDWVKATLQAYADALAR